MKKKLVTISIASYNNSRYLRKCIDSVLQQTYSEIEILIIDDGSTDDSELVYQEYLDKENIKIIHKENGGLSSVRQCALDNAKGDYIAFIDADDFLEKTYVENMFNRITKTDSDICVCSTWFLAENGEVLSELTEAYSFSTELETCSVMNDMLTNSYFKLLCKYFMCDSWNKLYSVSFLKQSNVVFQLPKGLNGTDLAFNHKILLHNPRICVVAKKEYYHVIYKKSAVHRKNKKLIKSVQNYILQIIDETEKLGKAKILAKQVDIVYLSAMRDVFQDVFFDKCQDEKDLREEFIQILNESMCFIKKNQIKIRIAQPTYSLMIFGIILKLRSITLLLMYFKQRRKKINQL